MYEKSHHQLAVTRITNYGAALTAFSNYIRKMNIAYEDLQLT